MAAPAPILRCSACAEVFASIEAMQEHYSAEYHANNVRLRVDGKKSMTAAEYRRSTTTTVEEKPVFACKLCNKVFRSVQTLQSHIRSTDHLMRKEKRIIERGSEAGSVLTSTSMGSAALGLHKRFKAHQRHKNHVDPKGSLTGGVEGEKPSAEDREEDVSETRCLMCGLPSKNMRENLLHMLEAHEFTIPLVHRCHDVRGLLQYLSRKMNGLMCLVCGPETKKFESLSALRNHMQSANHARVSLSSEYNAFYTGKLDDGEEATTVRKAVDGQLVIGAKAILMKDESGFVRPRRETQEQMVDRQLLTMAAHTENAVMLRERREVDRKANKKVDHLRDLHCGRRKRWYMEVGVRANKLHLKGFEGDGCN
jgi:pre-60S factor REI1